MILTKGCTCLLNFVLLLGILRLELVIHIDGLVALCMDYLSRYDANANARERQEGVNKDGDRV